MNPLQVGFLVMKSLTAILAIAVAAGLLRGQFNGRGSRGIVFRSQEPKSYDNEDSHFNS